MDGLILGDAAVSANIVSPILVVVVALTGLTAFAIPDYSFGGFFGIAFVLFVHLGVFASMNSFGVSYLSPHAPFSVNNTDGYLLAPIWKREDRVSFLDTKRKKQEAHVSMKWKFGGKS